MSQITRLPKGLQDLLGSKNFGVNPAELGQLVTPILDMFPFFAADRLSWAVENSTSFNTAQAPLVSRFVPEGELWLVDGFGANVASIAGPVPNDACMLSVSLRNTINTDAPIISFLHPLGFFDRYRPLAPDTVVTSYDLPMPRLLPLSAGTEILYNASDVDITAGNFSASFVCRYYRLTI